MHRVDLMKLWRTQLSAAESPLVGWKLNLSCPFCQPSRASRSQQYFRDSFCTSSQPGKLPDAASRPRATGPTKGLCLASPSRRSPFARKQPEEQSSLSLRLTIKQNPSLVSGANRKKYRKIPATSLLTSCVQYSTPGLGKDESPSDGVP
jgi:hypothetical protein